MPSDSINGMGKLPAGSAARPLDVTLDLTLDVTLDVMLATGINERGGRTGRRKSSINDAGAAHDRHTRLSRGAVTSFGDLVEVARPFGVQAPGAGQASSPTAAPTRCP